MPNELVAVPSVLLDRLTALGVDVARLLRRASILPSRFETSKARLTVHEFFAFWHALAAVGGRPDVGLRAGSEAMPHQFDVASLAALHASTLGDALQKFARYKQLVCAEQVTVDVVGDEAHVGFHWVHVAAASPMLLVDATFASILLLARRGFDHLVVPTRVELARRRADEPMLRGHFGCPIVFDAPRDVLVLDAALLQRRFVTHNADLLAMLVPGLEAALRDQPTSRSIADDARTILSRRMCGERPSVDKVAVEMHLSARTLQRRLDEAGTSYQRLLDDVRRDTARRLLLDTDLDAADIAFLLGFDEVNSFTRLLRVGACDAGTMASIRVGFVRRVVLTRRQRSRRLRRRPIVGATNEPPGEPNMSHPPNAIPRREALRRASLLLGGALSASTIAGVLAGCERPAAVGAGGTWQPRALSAAQSARVVALAEHILPATDTPGATDAHVVEFVDVMLADFYPAAERTKFLAGLDRVDARAQKAYGKAFLDGTSEQQASLVVALDTETFAKPAAGAAPRDPAAEQRNPVTQQGNVATGRGGPNDPGAVAASGGVATNGAPDPEDVAVRSFFRTLKELTLVGYYTSEAGATRELRVNPMGTYRGDVPYGSLGHAWA